jgi:hypothetical protein
MWVSVGDWLMDVFMFVILSHALSTVCGLKCGKVDRGVISGVTVRKAVGAGEAPRGRVSAVGRFCGGAAAVSLYVAHYNLCRVHEGPNAKREEKPPPRQWAWPHGSPVADWGATGRGTVGCASRPHDY